MKSWLKRVIGLESYRVVSTTLQPYNPVRAFTLIELLVTISIFVFMTALLLSRYGAFNQGTLLTNLAYDVALTIRTAQTYGISVKDATGANSYSSSYGVYFNPAANQSQFTLFADTNTNNYYDSPADTIVSTYNLKNGAKISPTSAGGVCIGSMASDCVSEDQLSITFKRPDPEAIICGTKSGTTACGSSYAQITIQSADGTSFHTIVVRQNGQILVANTSVAGASGSPSGGPVSSSPPAGGGGNEGEN